MTALGESLSSCTFSDALYVTARDGEITSEEKSGTASEYFSAPTHMDDSGMSCSPPSGCFLSSSDIDTSLLEETLEEAALEEKAHKEEKSSDTLSHNATSNSFIIVSSSRNRSSGGSSSSRPPASSRSARSSRCSGSSSISTFMLDGSVVSNDDFFDQPSMEYDDAFAPCAQSSPTKSEHQKREKIILRELSFDELQDVKGIDLMAPVFLAVTNDADDSNVYDLKRKCKSIEDLCSTINQPDLDG